jgi:hypothetical protein
VVLLLTLAAYAISIRWTLALAERTHNSDSVQHTLKMLQRLRLSVQPPPLNCPSTWFHTHWLVFHILHGDAGTYLMCSQSRKQPG